MLWRLLSPIYVTIAQYTDIEADFKNMWNIPNCVGAIDGKHIALKLPPNSGSMFSLQQVTVGSYGCESDGDM